MFSSAAGAKLPALPVGFKWDEKALDKARRSMPGIAKTDKLAAIFGRFESPAGLVTLEDILEEIVGEFTTDPATVTHKDVQRDAAGNWLINASATIRALNRALGWSLPALGPRTLNGLLLTLEVPRALNDPLAEGARGDLDLNPSMWERAGVAATKPAAG